MLPEGNRDNFQPIVIRIEEGIGDKEAPNMEVPVEIIDGKYSATVTLDGVTKTGVCDVVGHHPGEAVNEALREIGEESPNTLWTVDFQPFPGYKPPK